MEYWSYYAKIRKKKTYLFPIEESSWMHNAWLDHLYLLKGLQNSLNARTFYMGNLKSLYFLKLKFTINLWNKIGFFTIKKKKNLIPLWGVQSIYENKTIIEQHQPIKIYELLIITSIHSSLRAMGWIPNPTKKKM